MYSNAIPSGVAAAAGQGGPFSEGSYKGLLRWGIGEATGDHARQQEPETISPLCLAYLPRGEMSQRKQWLLHCLFNTTCTASSLWILLSLIMD